MTDTIKHTETPIFILIFDPSYAFPGYILIHSYYSHNDLCFFLYWLWSLIASKRTDGLQIINFILLYNNFKSWITRHIWCQWLRRVYNRIVPWLFQLTTFSKMLCWTEVLPESWISSSLSSSPSAFDISSVVPPPVTPSVSTAMVVIYKHSLYYIFCFQRQLLTPAPYIRLSPCVLSPVYSPFWEMRTN